MNMLPKIKQFDINDFIYYDDNTNTLILDTENMNFAIKTKKNINYDCGNLNVISKQNICFDSLNNNSIHLNSKMAEQIKNNLESIHYRENSVEEMITSWYSHVKHDLGSDPSQIEVFSMYKELYKKFDL